ncbi:MAG: lactonase family protein [Saprospiraceae bacterium]|nr:lactonase family protein [Saprospiraceae bacterium]
MKQILILLSIISFLGCGSVHKPKSEMNQGFAFFLGTYTDEGSHGIYSYYLNQDGSMVKRGLAAKSENPSFLCLSTDKLYLVAVNETDKNGLGTVESYLINGDSLSLLSTRSSGGAHPCFVTINSKGYILTANYTGGNLGLLKLDENGQLSDLLDTEQHYGQGTTQRQKAPHVHSAWFESNSDNIISVDLGTNELWFSKLETEIDKIRHRGQEKLKMADGAGPRHLAMHPDKKWIYVVNELNCTVSHVLKSKNNNYSVLESYSTLPEDFSGSNTCADIHVTSDGKFVYASNRGHNSIAVFSVNPSDGTLTLIANESARGKNPRNFALSPDEKLLLVANQTTNNIVSFKRDRDTGLLSFLSEIEAPKPVCILFR